jgi:hypothetical protein
MSETYSVNCKCSNCDHVGPVELAKGTPCDGPMMCPNCGCKSARKHAPEPYVPAVIPWRREPVDIRPIWITPQPVPSITQPNTCPPPSRFYPEPHCDLTPKVTCHN